MAIDPAGDAVAVWDRPNGSNFIVQAAARPAGGSFGAPVDLSLAGQNAFDPQVAIDPAGDAVAVWDRSNGANTIVQAAGYDFAGPQLKGLSIPVSGTVRTPVSFGVSPLDTWSGVASTTWSFGDGQNASGAAVPHVYAAAGSYHVSVTSVDGDGNATTATGSITIAALPPRAATKATISRLSATNRVFAVARASTPLTGSTARRHKRGTVFSFLLDQPATVKIAIQTNARGRRVGRRCRPDTRRLRAKPRCTRTITLATLTRTAHARLNKVAFSGRIRRKALKPSRYHARFTAIDRAGASKAKTLSFTIARR